MATAYATVSVGDVKPEMDMAAKAVKELNERLTEAAKKAHTAPRDVLPNPELVFLLGQADVATIIETSNFKRIFDLNYPRAAESPAGVVNWVFSVPYALDTGERPIDASMRFILHLRLRRAAYSYPEIERTIVEKLVGLLGVNQGGARIHVGLGWSDLVVDGWFKPATFQALTEFIISVHGLKLVTGNREKDTIPLLQRTLTVLGYVGNPPEFGGNYHLTFLRTRAGSHDKAVELLTSTDPVTHKRIYGDDLYALDGKADYMLQSLQAAPDWLARQRTLGDGTYRDLLRKVETHLMFMPAQQFKNEGAGLSLQVAGEPTHKEICGCESVAKAPVESITQATRLLEASHLLPTEYRYAVDNTLFLLAAPLRDSSICCDARDAIMACFAGLQKVLSEIGAIPSKSSVSADDTRYDELVSLWRQLDEWHRFSEMLLRQRTVGSYEEILGQSDRSVVYSGGVQKFLFLSDQLVKDFARRVEPKETPRFATIFDSVKTIYSFRTGLIRVPTSEIFSFPLIVPDLWHEVGGYLFFLRIAGSLRPRLPKGREGNEFLANLADHYADIIVYAYGFYGDFNRFVASRIHVWHHTYGDVPYVNLSHRVNQLLLRLYLVYELHKVRAARESGEFQRFQDEPEQVIEELVNQLRFQLTNKYPKSVETTDEDWELLRTNVKTQDFSNFHRKLYHGFMTIKLSRPDVSMAAFRRGELVRFAEGDDLNAYFGELAFSMLDPDRDDDTPMPHFQMMASLGKSAAIEYHRREITRGRS
ncbi:MAG TPA: hypothetical protein VEK79_03765 [Thermoanaerobaculia bacterium]|nr:hypothetical protein [Thermoanaerobaculia bacterium]